MHFISLLYSLSHWQIDLIVVCLLLASAVITLIPEEAVFITLGCLAWSGRIHPAEAILIAMLGLIPADVLTVWFGRQLERKLLQRKPFKFIFSKHSVTEALSKLHNSGNKVLFLARFTPLLRAPLYLAAGAAGFSLRRAAAIDSLSAAIQVTVFFCIGFAFGAEARDWFNAFSFAIPAAVIAMLLVNILHAMRLRRRRQVASDR